MAGGPLAQSVVCFPCLESGEVVEAKRVYEGMEDDQYACDKGHRFGVDYRRGPATEAQWPPTPEMAEALKGAFKK